jgi:GrpB-like predicted nucleotidyltransferase (UPF0157 family)/photosystem II stability/assembly factor-like uncharacterized protein
MARLYATTGDGLARLDESGGEWTVELFLEGTRAQCLAVDPADRDTAYAGLREGGVRRTSDAGRSWDDCSPPDRGVFSLAVSAADGAVYAGTEPSRLFRSDDRGESWRALDALLELPSRPTWSFPPRPWTSHVRWIAPSPHDAELLLVGIELGGLMRSTDRGDTWQDHRPDAQPDVHSLAWHPREVGRAYEAGGGGSAFSIDAGETWRPADDGRDRHYTWSVAVDPYDPECWYVSASTGPFAAHGGREPQALIYRRRDGEPWQALGGGLPEPLPAMPYALVAADGRLFAGLADGQLWESGDRGDTWRACTLRGDALPAINALAYARDDDPDERLRSVTIGEPQLLAGPVLLADYDPDWPQLFRHEAGRIRDALGPRALQVEHVGSTSVPGLAAKPTIDISLAVADSADEHAYVPALEAAGYVLRIREPDWFEHRLFGRPDAHVNLHVFSAGCTEIDRMLRFRDRLRRNHDDRALYERTKRELAQRDWKYVQNYADAKSAVVEAILARSGEAAFIDSS